MDHIKLIGLGVAALILLVLACISSRRRRAIAMSFSHDGAEIPDYFDDDGSVTNVRVANQAAVAAEQRSSDAAAARPEAGITVMHLIAEQGESFVGFELLQALLSAKLRFGDMNIFHRHELDNGEGDIIFSVAQATEPGTFDMENMGSLRCRGLTFFMKRFGDSRDDAHQRLLEQTLLKLRDELGGVILDQNKQAV